MEMDKQGMKGRGERKGWTIWIHSLESIELVGKNVDKWWGMGVLF